MQVSNS